MKKIEEWLEEFDEPQKAQIMDNLIKLNCIHELKTLAKSKKSALENAFTWLDSKEGHSYWYIFAQTLTEENEDIK